MCIGEVCVFFQGEDGIRDSSVTGVQTCALPIFPDKALLFSLGREYLSSSPAAALAELPAAKRLAAITYEMIPRIKFPHVENVPRLSDPEVVKRFHFL